MDGNMVVGTSEYVDGLGVGLGENGSFLVPCLPYSGGGGGGFFQNGGCLLLMGPTISDGCVCGP